MTDPQLFFHLQIAKVTKLNTLFEGQLSPTPALHQ